MKIIRGLEHIPNKEKQREQGVFNTEKGLEDLTAAFHYLWGNYKWEGDRVFHGPVVTGQGRTV